MSGIRGIKKRIRATVNIAQITKAIEAVSAVKMRKSQEIALRSQPYAAAALEILRRLTERIGSENVVLSPLLEKRPPSQGLGEPRPLQKTCLIAITSDKGLCGALNGNVLRKAMDLMKEIQGEIEIVAVGKKGADFLKRRGFSVIKEFTQAGDFATLEETRLLSDFIRGLYLQKKCDQVFTVSAAFISTFRQEAAAEKILPFSADDLEQKIAGIAARRGKKSPAKTGNLNYGFEPSPKEVFDRLLPYLLEIQIYRLVMEANASEHSSRMMAMKNASENAGDLIKSLTLSYNKERQAQITKELAEISAAL